MKINNAMTVEFILNNYDGTVIMLAAFQFLHVGIENYQSMDLDKECAMIADETPKNPLISVSMQKNILRCAYDIAKLNPNDIIRLFKKIPLSGINTMEGKILKFKHNCTSEDITYVRIDNSTSDDAIEKAAAYIEESIEEYGSKNMDDFEKIDLIELIYNALSSIGANPKEIECYKEISL